MLSNQSQRGRGQPVLSGGLSGRQLGHFELAEAVGVGGMAAVIRARDLQLARVVALKILPPEMAADPENITRFKHEARAAAKLDHENIARVYFCGEDQGLHFIAFEFVEGVNLKTFVEERGPLQPAECVHYMLQVATGLDHAASRGVVHRDIKPSNILITPEGKAKIVDMGLARNLDTPFAGGVTQSGVTLGTFDYISPEQAMEPRTADARSDIYSLGCTFYHALTGRPPVPEGTAAKKLHYHQHVAPTDPRALNPDIPDVLAATLGRMMAKDPAQRFQTPDELVRYLNGLSELWQSAGEKPRPVARPGMAAALAGASAAVLAAVMAVVVAAPDVAPRESPAPWRASATASAATTAPQSAPASVPAPVTPAGPRQRPLPPAAVDPSPGGRLRARLEAGESVVALEPGEYELDAPLVFRGRQLELTASDRSQPPVIRARPGLSLPALLTLEAGVAGRDIVFRDIVFETGGPGRAGCGVRADGDGLSALRLQYCQFRNTAPREDDCAVRFDGRERPEEPARVVLSGCAFWRGGSAVSLSGRARVEAKQCVFGPHAVVFRFRAGDEGADARPSGLSLERCSVLLENGEVVRSEGRGGVGVSAALCLFSRVGAGEGVLIKRVGSGNVSYEPGSGVDGALRGNGYHNLSALVRDEQSAPPVVITDPLALREAEMEPVSDSQAVKLDASPWRSADAAALLAGPEPLNAFVPVPRAVVLGATRLQLGRQELAVATDAQETGPSLGVKTFAPAAAPDEARRGVFTTPEELGRALQPGDAIEVRHDGPVKLRVSADWVRRAGGSLTIRAARKHRPVLVLDSEPADQSPPALVTISEGHVRLEGLQFWLRPSVQTQTRNCSVVDVCGGSSVEMVGCAVTLAEPAMAAGAVRPAVVSLRDPQGVLTLGADRPVPRVTFRDCFVRGRGELVRADTSRQFAVDAENVLAALDGTAVNVSSAGREANPGGPARLKFSNVTTYLTGQLLHLGVRHDDGRPAPVPAEVTANRCLFMTPGEGEALVVIDAAEREEVTRGLVSWVGSRCVYDWRYRRRVLTLRSDSLPVAQDLGEERWQALPSVRDEGGLFSAVEPVAKPPDGMSPRFSQARPKDFKPSVFQPPLPPLEPVPGAVPSLSVDDLPE